MIVGPETNNRAAMRIGSLSNFSLVNKTRWLYYQAFCAKTAILIVRALGDVTANAILVSMRTPKVHPYPATYTMPFSHCIDFEMKVRKL